MGDPCVWFAMRPSCADDDGDDDLAMSHTISASRICSTTLPASDTVILHPRVLFQKKKKPQSVSRTAAAAAARQETSATPAISTSARPMHVFSHPTQPISARSTIHRRKATKKQSKRYIHIRTPRSTSSSSLPLTRLPAESDPGSTSSHAKQLQIVQASIPGPGKELLCCLCSTRASLCLAGSSLLLHSTQQYRHRCGSPPPHR